MVGTITVIVTWWRSMTSSTAAGWKTGTKVVCPPTAGTARTPPSEAAWNIGVWCRYTNSSFMPQRVATLYMSSIRARLSMTTPLGRPVVPPVYMRMARSSSSGSGGTTGAPAATRSS